MCSYGFWHEPMLCVMIGLPVTVRPGWVLICKACTTGKNKTSEDYFDGTCIGGVFQVATSPLRANDSGMFCLYR